MRLGKGYRRDPPHKRTQQDARRLLGATIAAAPDRDLSSFEAPRFNQLSYEGCLGHGTSQGIIVALAAAGTPLDFVPSPLGIYTITRCIDRGAPGTPLTDSGGMPADCMAGISQWGVRPIGPLNPGGNTDCTDELINAEPMLGDLEQDARALIVGEYRVDEQSLDIVPTLRGLIAKGVPIGIGCFVDTSFMQWSGGAPYGAPNQSDPNGDGHWMVIVGTRTEADGSTSFRLCNSWGPTWGDGTGHVWVTEAFVRAAWDLYALTVREVKS